MIGVGLSKQEAQVNAFYVVNPSQSFASELSRALRHTYVVDVRCLPDGAEKV